MTNLLNTNTKSVNYKSFITIQALSNYGPSTWLQSSWSSFDWTFFWKTYIYNIRSSKTHYMVGQNKTPNRTHYNTSKCKSAASSYILGKTKLIPLHQPWSSASFHPSRDSQGSRHTAPITISNAAVLTAACFLPILVSRLRLLCYKSAAQWRPLSDLVTYIQHIKVKQQT